MKYKHTSKEHKNLTLAVTKFIAQDMLPIYAVDKKGFRSMMEIANPQYDLPHSNHFRRVAIPNLYNTGQAEIESKISDKKFLFLSNN